MAAFFLSTNVLIHDRPQWPITATITLIYTWSQRKKRPPVSGYPQAHRAQTSLGMYRWLYCVTTQYPYYVYHLDVNPLRAKFFRGNKNIYLHFMSILHIDMTQVVGILPSVRQGLVYIT